MSEFEDLYAAAADEEPEEPPLPGYHQARSRVTRLPETRMTASPEGGGTTRGGLGTTAEPTGEARVIEDAELPDIFEKDAPAAPPTAREVRDHTRAVEDAAEGRTDDTSFFGDLVSGMGAAVPTAGHRRMGRAMTRAAEEAPEDPAALLLGSTDLAGLGLNDDLWGALTSRPEVRAGQSGSRAGTATESRPARTFDEGREEAREVLGDARDRSPYAFGAGEVGGTVAGGLALGALEPLAADTALARLAQGGLTGELYGAASGLGHSEADDLQGLAHDTAEGGLLGLGGAAVMGPLGEGARALGRFGRQRFSQEASDRAILAAASGESPVGVAAMRRWGRSPEQLHTAAERVRRLGLVGPASTAQDVLERGERQVARLGDAGAIDPALGADASGDELADLIGDSSTGVVGDIARRLESESEGLPVRDLLEVFEREAARLERDPETAQYAAALRRRGEQWARSFGGIVEGADGPMSDLGATVRPERVRESLGTMRQATTWVDPALGEVRPPVQAQRDLHRGLSGVRDRHADDVLGPGTGEAYAGARRDLQASLQSRDLTRDSLQRSEGRRAISPTDMMAGIGALAGGHAVGGTTGLGAAGLAVGAGFLNRLLRSREAALGATGTEAMRRLFSSPALARYGPQLERAMRRGVPALTAMHETLLRRDPEYRAAVEEAEQTPEPDPEAEAAFLDMYDTLTSTEAPQ